MALNLPKPKYSVELPTAGPARPSVSASSSTKQFEPPKYGKRGNFVPRSVEDFGDGGAFPEIKVRQFPLGMGQKGAAPSGQTTLLRLDSSGKVQHDLVLRQNMRSDQIVHSKYEHMQARLVDESTLLRPSAEETAANVERTRLALQAKLDVRTSAAAAVSSKNTASEPVFIRYTPNSISSCLLLPRPLI